MRNIPLGSTGETISELCLGTMTWGTQTPPEDAFRQMDQCLEAGITIIDTAEMYPVNPVRADTVGGSEAIIGQWNAANPARRGDYLLATKISGLNERFVRPGEPITGKTLRAALEGSLRRCQSDYIDIYQLHWPNRGSFQFRQNWSYDPSGQDKAATLAHMNDVLEEAGKLVAEGKMRHFALSNESAWGTSQWLRIAEDRGLPRVQVMQNEYSLLCRMYDTDMAEMAVNEAVTLLAFSPLACGLLTGKYQGGAVPEGSRKSLAPELGGRWSARVNPAVVAYLAIAAKHGLDPVAMALAWLQSRPFPVTAIFGATTSAQLARILPAAGMVLGGDVLDDIAAAHRAHPMPY
jgi:aryl-alcohol dehydrogenase-like predicted oxidoreductase